MATVFSQSQRVVVEPRSADVSIAMVCLLAGSAMTLVAYAWGTGAGAYVVGLSLMVVGLLRVARAR